MALPLLALGLAAAGAAAGGGAGALGIGKNSYRQASFADTKNYDPNRFEYGGRPGGADADAARMRFGAEQAQTRQGEQVNYGQADWDRQQAGQARIGQQGMADLMSQRAQGLAPSIAQMQADRQMGQATAAQASAAASARGAGGLALAQQNAANNTATMQSAISNEAQVNAANERMAAEQAAFGAYSGMRGGDLSSQQQAAQQAQYQSQLNAQQRQQNDQFSLGMTGYEQGIRNQQLNAGIQQQGMLANQHTAAGQINSGVNQANANNEWKPVQLAMGLAQGGADSGASMGKRAAGGPVAAGKPYLVGEEGPELVVPASNGVVIPNGPTMGLLGGGGGGDGMAVLGAGGGMDVMGTLRKYGDMSGAFKGGSGGMRSGGLF